MKIQFIYVVLLNLIIIAILILFLNYIIYKFFYTDLEYAAVKHLEWFDKNETYPLTYKRYEMTDEDIKKVYPMREFVGTEYKKKGIVMFGCSYGYGLPLNIDQTFQYKLSHQLRRPV